MININVCSVDIQFINPSNIPVEVVYKYFACAQLRILSSIEVKTNGDFKLRLQNQRLYRQSQAFWVLEIFNKNTSDNRR